MPSQNLYFARLMTTPGLMARLFAVLSLTLLTSLVLLGCGEKEADVVRPFRPQYEAYAKELAAMAAQEPKQALLPGAPLNPKPVMKPEMTESNTVVFMFPQLTDAFIGLPPKNLEPDLKLSQQALTQLRTGTLPEDKMTGPARVKEKEDLTAGLSPRYIGAVKMLAYQKGKMTSTESFESGKAQAVVMLFDRQATKPVYAELVTAANDDSIDVAFFKDKPLTMESGQGWVDMNLAKNLKNAVLAKFASATGGTFEANPLVF
jgi:hypothetical protein